MTTLQVENVDLLQKSNGTAHRTSDYMTDQLVVRRHQTFTMKITFNRSVQLEDDLKWWTQTGPAKSSPKTIVPIPIPGLEPRASSTEKSWSATSEADSDKSMKITIKSPADAAIGSYLMGFQVKSAEGDVSQPAGGYLMLFNPWNEDDAVYMKEEAERKEYVLCDYGIIFYGSASSNPPFRPWDFGQFEGGILEICLKMLDKSTEYRRNAAADVSRRGDPTYVTRILSAMVNSPGDSGVLVGNWSGDYEGGVPPTQWNGSVEILRKWNESGPVRYGQCWVYGGVLCTALRCLGIPARVITNFASAHDVDANLTIDKYIDENGNEMDESSDSIWNFHVWNEGYFARKDIGTQYNGWQVLDATPQEESQGSYRLGPCSVNAVKEGDIDKPYDGTFVFSEVNGDRVDWLVKNNVRKRLRTQTSAIGKFTSTKAIGSNKRVDVTNNYKYTEGTKKERDTFKKAVALTSSTFSIRSRMANAPSTVAFAASDTEPVPKPDFEGAFTQSTNPQVGHDVTFTLVLKSISSVAQTLTLKMTASSIVYTNAMVKEILSQDHSVTLEPKKEKKIPFTVPYAKYETTLTTDNMIKAVAMCEDEKGGKLLVDSVMKLASQPIVIKATGEIRVNQPLHLQIIFINPLSEEVDNSVLTVVGSGLVKEPVKIEIPHLKKNERSVTNLTITPYRSGPRCLMVDLTSEKFRDVKGTLEINVPSA